MAFEVGVWSEACQSAGLWFLSRQICLNDRKYPGQAIRVLPDLPASLAGGSDEAS
jgi:hypothetical protein